MDKELNRFLKSLVKGFSWGMRLISAKKFMEHDNSADRLAHLGLHLGGEAMVNEISAALDNDYKNEINKTKNNEYSQPQPMVAEKDKEILE